MVKGAESEFLFAQIRTEERLQISIWTALSHHHYNMNKNIHFYLIGIWPSFLTEEEKNDCLPTSESLSAHRLRVQWMNGGKIRVRIVVGVCWSSNYKSLFFVLYVETIILMIQLVVGWLLDCQTEEKYSHTASCLPRIDLPRAIQQRDNGNAEQRNKITDSNLFRANREKEKKFRSQSIRNAALCIESATISPAR